ncbi:MAG: flagellar hook-associated protein FlgK [Deltaproteobacteria bacterium]|nr:flagellar hook-associated protein FlgK [Deltaproteobacteria bacterium]
MAGISHVLSIAKEALLTHQLSIQVASNNIANVDTPGYTRQSLQLEANNATPISAGMLGGGVTGTKILRNYDQFMVQRLANQESSLGSLQAQQDSMKLVETVFNEAPGLAINDLMSKFWGSWQGLADNPDVPATRQAVIQSSQLIVDQLHSMASQMVQAKFDISTSLDTAVGDVNSITSQIADLNVQISGAESSAGQANDLRDKRDTLVQNLSSLLDVTYFEDKNGGYTVLMADGHTLVDGNQTSKVDWANNKLLWISKDNKGAETSQPIGAGAELGGKIGGWLEVRGNLAEGDPNNFLGRLDAFANSLIREINQQHSQGVGLTVFGDSLTGSEQVENVARLTTPVDASTANMAIPAGTITINDRPVGEIIGGVAVKGLAMTKAANAVTAINAAEAGVEARLTTLTAGTAVTDPGVANIGKTISFDINGVTVSYPVVAGDVGAGNVATFAGHLVGAITSALNTYNALPTTANPITIEAVVGDGTNGGAANSIVLKNTNPGDESNIVIDNLTSSVAGLAASTGLTAGTYNADASHNTGEITLFSTSTITVDAGPNDYTLAQLGMGGGNQATTFYDGGTVDNTSTNPLTTITFNLNGKPITVNALANQSATQLVAAVQAGINAAPAPPPAITVSLVNGKIHFENNASGDNTPIVVDSFTTTMGNGAIFGFGNFTAQVGKVAGDTVANDGKFTFTYEDGPEGPLLSGYKYFNQLSTDKGSFDIWIYNKDDGTLAMPKPVTISLDRAYSLNDVTNIINKTVAAATNSSGWVTASNSDNSLRLTPDATHQFAFANDTSNFLQVAGLNTFFSGNSAASIGLNSMITSNLNNLAAATVNSLGEIYSGDNTNSLKITNAQHDEYVTFTGGTQNTLDGFYNTLVGQVANTSRTVSQSYDSTVLVNKQVSEMRDSVSGVSLDEEMANLIKYQHAYTAAARLITMSDEMLKTLLDAV